MDDPRGYTRDIQGWVTKSIKQNIVSKWKVILVVVDGFSFRPARVVHTVTRGGASSNLVALGARILMYRLKAVKLELANHAQNSLFLAETKPQTRPFPFHQTGRLRLPSI